MDISQTTQAASAAQVATKTAQSTASEAMISSDFETFLKMLTAQMENQDPLNPIESTDYAVQLATFSGVEQQVQTNDLLKGLAGQLGLMGMSDLAGWVGMEARVAAPTYFDGSPVTLSPTPPSTADQAVLVVRDRSGAEVSRTPVPASSDPMEWAGMDPYGNPLPKDTYTFELESYGNGYLLSTEPVKAYSLITETQMRGTEMVLVLEGGATIEADAVSALRDPSLR
ncbi:flagellar hook capping FlgD N-terminal domain-containing protein [Aliiroseovarius subalbicans]|uniref:flagellar hook capping FlgD N-terminal domain-containing protein n=1 Tax=Aliiroseovarius subalbicans TaxID=2925840 RepID=UPI001F58A246|nr:flagellar hook capping FlgD N-terminal domain-containing protein [Aliiroseovarius subalbicans]MCI2400226.1 flagellar hook assembly protein FlgD [Aliiroseovarius subalbicans]